MPRSAAPSAATQRQKNLGRKLAPPQFLRSIIPLTAYPGCDLDVPERTGEDCGRQWLDPVMLEDEDEDEEEASKPGLLLDERENVPGKLSSV